MEDALKAVCCFFFVVCLFWQVNRWLTLWCGWLERRENGKRTKHQELQDHFKHMTEEEVAQLFPNAEMVGGPLDGLLVQLPSAHFFSGGPSGVLGREQREDGSIVLHSYLLHPGQMSVNGLAVCRYEGRLTAEQVEQRTGEARQAEGWTGIVEDR